MILVWFLCLKFVFSIRGNNQLVKKSQLDTGKIMIRAFPSGRNFVDLWEWFDWREAFTWL